ncbi:MAG: spore coat protein U domain-containing protein [Hyphomonadaceae bacterium]|nr:spore coat protein U domain-containing protein [Hyphomonadaceae bacterium]
MRRRLALLAFVAVLAAPSQAEALLCTPILGCSCSVSATDMAMTPVQPLAGIAGTGVSDIAVDCTHVIDVLPSLVVKFGAGLNGAIADRRMKNAAGDLLAYNIYTSTAYTTILGDGTGGFAGLTLSGGLLSLGHWTATGAAYGRAPAVPSAKPGDYTDTITVRIDW